MVWWLLMTNENDSILVFEYFTASGEKDKCIISEAEALIFALLDDLSDFKFEIIWTTKDGIDPKYYDIAKREKTKKWIRFLDS